MANIYAMSDTWNDGATAFTAIKMDVTNTASAAASNLMDLQIGGASFFRVDKTGNTYIPRGASYSVDRSGTIYPLLGLNSANVRVFGDLGGNTNPRVMLNAGDITLQYAEKQVKFKVGVIGAESWTFSHDYFYPETNSMDQRNGTNAQGYNIYNTYTDASNYERGFVKWDTNVLKIGTEAAGTGTVREVHISGLPTSNPGAGILWNDAGTVKVGT